MDRSVVVVVRVLFALSNKLRGRRITEVERDYTTWIASRRGKRKLSFVDFAIKTDNKIFSNLSLIYSSLLFVKLDLRVDRKRKRRERVSVWCLVVPCSCLCYRH